MKMLKERVLDQVFKAGQRIFVGGSSNQPTDLLAHLAHLELPARLNFIQFPLAGYNAVDFTGWNDTATLTTFFMTPTLAKADSSRVFFLPMQMRSVFEYLKSDIDVALIQVARDREGVLRIGPNVDFVEAVLAASPIVIAELNSAVVAPAGCPQISQSRIDYVFESHRSLLAPDTPKIDTTALEIGKLVAELVKDGDCLQTGIGAIPAAILSELHSKNDLGLHGGLIDDGGMKLIQQGNVTGKRKFVDRGLHVTGMALGSAVMMQWLAETPQVVFRGADHTHEVAVIRQLDDFVSVNSAVEVDLLGQVNAEYAGGRQISGIGGSVDFMRAAKSSIRGRSIVAMTATARRGSVSRIVARVEMVTALRSDVDLVVTEFGIADIKHLSNAARTQALINIAAPQFRDALRDR